MPAALATFRYPAAWSATPAWALSPLGLSSTNRRVPSHGESCSPMAALGRLKALR